MNTILVVDDESKIRQVIKEYGKVNGYNVLEAQDGDSAIEIVKKEKINCIILDIMLPNIDGFTACQMIKKICNTPIIMLSARVSEEDKLLGFDLGVDDYVEKPFSPKVLMAKIKVVIDRNIAANSSNLIQFDGVSVDIEGHTVKVDDNLVHLTNKEFDLLLYFLTESPYYCVIIIHCFYVFFKYYFINIIIFKTHFYLILEKLCLWKILFL